MYFIFQNMPLSLNAKLCHDKENNFINNKWQIIDSHINTNKKKITYSVNHYYKISI
jgi:hypothetical protein